MKPALLCLLLFSFITSLQAKSLSNQRNHFLNAIFQNQPPKIKRFVLTPKLKKAIKKIIGHPYLYQRIKYWQKGDQTVWILSEIGKTKQITAGFLIKNQQIEQVKVLAFRESRGGEIRYNFFTEQFKQAQLTTDNQLNQYIDGITGATLSVRAMTKMAKLALFLQKNFAKK